MNVDNVRKRLSQLLAWLDSTKPDVAALHEQKAETAAFPRSESVAAGYSCLVAGQRRWNGVALLSRDYGTINAPDGISSSRISRGYQGKLPVWGDAIGDIE